MKFGIGVAVGSNGGDGIRRLGWCFVEIGFVVFGANSLFVERDIRIVIQHVFVGRIRRL